MVRPWAQAGFECWAIDTDHDHGTAGGIRSDRVEKFEGGGLIRYQWGDCRSWRLPESARGRVAMGFGFPPCTHIALSGARDHRTKGGWMLADALQIFDSIEVAFSYGGFPYFLENPMSKLSTHRRAPDYKFQPWEYGDLWFKETWLWVGNGFVMPRRLHHSPPEGTTEKIFRLTPSEDREAIRSETPPGFARAVFEANAQPILERLAA